jgi:hypothetical protein
LYTGAVKLDNSKAKHNARKLTLCMQTKHTGELTSQPLQETLSWNVSGKVTGGKI